MIITCCDVDNPGERVTGLLIKGHEGLSTGLVPGKKADMV